jgi:AcrR family transcriptional regulator
MVTRRDEIVEIAAELFAEKGFVSTTVREIAERAGILSGSLYHQFDSKEAIAAEVLDRYYSGMVDKFRVLLSDGDNEADILADFIRAAYRGIREQPNAVALVVNSGEQLFQLDAFEHVRIANEELDALWLKLLRSGVSKGVFRPSLEPRLTHTFIRDALWPTIRWWRPGGKYSIDTIAELFIDTISNGVVQQPKHGSASSSKAGTTKATTAAAKVAR